MVVFTCGECGEAMKKAQVESHYARKCRNCNVLSCLDCGKDFWGKDYEQHTKCISEEEKYSGKGYVAKPNANKGEVKQQHWLQEVQNAIDKVKTNPKLKNILERMKDYENIPRKKAKFENFMKNSLRVYDKGMAAQVWDLLMTNTEKPKPAAQAPTQNGDNSSPQANTNSDRLEQKPDSAQNGDEQPEKKLSKREKKEERRKKANKSEKKDKHMNGGDVDEDTEGHKKKKKRKKQDSDVEEEDEEEDEGVKQGKKRKREEPDEENEVDEDDTEEPSRKAFKTKFAWNNVVVELLRSKGEMKLKKLRRKVLAEYLAQGCTAKSEEKLWAKFDSKLKKNSAVKVLHEKAKLIV